MIFGIIISALSGDIESILILMPIFFIAIFSIYIIKGNIRNILRNIKIPKIKKEVSYLKHEEKSIDYILKLKEIKGIRDSNLNVATGKLLSLINIFLSDFLKAKKVLTYEELAKEFKKRKLIIVYNFCRKLSLISFSRENIEKNEFDGIVKDFKFILDKYHKDVRTPEKISLSTKLLETGELKKVSKAQDESKEDELLDLKDSEISQLEINDTESEEELLKREIKETKKAILYNNFLEAKKIYIDIIRIYNNLPIEEKQKFYYDVLRIYDSIKQ